MTESANPSYLADLYAEEIYNIPPRVTIVIPGTWASLTEPQQLLLSKIMQAANIPLAAAVIRSAPTLTPAEATTWNARELIIFGSRTTPAIPAYVWTTWSETAVLYADALGDLDDQKKKSLWKALKEKYHR